MFNWRQQALHDIIVKPELHWPYLRPCTVRLLIVADGLDFSAQDFGLSTFVQTLLDMPGRHVRFNITLGHIDNVGANEMMGGEPRIARRITRLRFDDAAHFATDMYDVVLLFGIAVSFVAGEEKGWLRDIEKLTGVKLQTAPLPADFATKAAALPKPAFVREAPHGGRDAGRGGRAAPATPTGEKRRFAPKRAPGVGTHRGAVKRSGGGR
jgi:hypothetical protein